MDSRFSRNNIEDFLLYYSYYFPSRRLNKEKEAVYRFIAEKFEDLAYDVTFDSIKVGMNKVGCCILGDLKKAQKIYIAPLDTSKITHLPSFKVYPLNEEKRNRMNVAADALEVLLGFAGVVAVCLISSRFLTNRIAIALIAAAFMVIYNFLQSNRFTFSRSSAMALVSVLAAENKDPGNAYVFLDRCADSYFGLKMFLVKHKELCRKAKKLYYFDFMANGEKLLYIAKKRRNMDTGDLEITDISVNDADISCFEVCENLVMILCADEEKGEYVVNKIRTAEDKHVDVARLKKLLKVL